MQLRWISATAVSEYPVDAAAELLARADGLVLLIWAKRQGWW